MPKKNRKKKQIDDVLKQRRLSPKEPGQKQFNSIIEKRTKSLRSKLKSNKLLIVQKNMKISNFLANEIGVDENLSLEEVTQIPNPFDTLETFEPILSWINYNDKSNIIMIIDISSSGNNVKNHVTEININLIKYIRLKSPNTKIITYPSKINKETRQKLRKLGITREYILRSSPIKAKNDIREIKRLIKKDYKYTPPGNFYTTSYNSETTKGEDKLNITPDVNAIANLIANKNVTPPLSIGLFADWGSGKSFFMKKLEERILYLSETFEKEVALEEENKFFAKNILSIPFNTWHYIDANLWCSLLSKILENIAEKLLIETGKSAKIKNLIEEMSLFKDLLEDLSLEKKVLQDKKKETEKQISAVHSKIETLRSTPTRGVTENEYSEEERTLKEDEVKYSTEISKINARIRNIKENGNLSRQVPQLIERYNNNLGLISLIRKDLEYLNNKFKEDAFPIERIVLYIDDLDRCPPNRVVEVLQAIHLLLAFPLFVVVVGVDKRWVSHSIKKVYLNLDPEICGDNDSPDSSDYLEKIFQIPYHLRSIDSGGVKNLVDDLLKDDLIEEEGEKIEETLEEGEASAILNEHLEREAETETVRTDEEATEEMGSVFKEGAKVQITKEEKDFIHVLSPLLTKSPRAVKRFINTYRILRVHEEGPNDLKEQKVVLYFLALITGHTGTNEEIFRGVLDVDSVADIVQRISPFSPEIKDETLKEFLEKTKQVLSLNSDFYTEIPLSDLKKFVSLVQRFSFQ